jgi:hypothetical protein
MHKKSARKRGLAAATRGLIVQRVLVDRWTFAEAGAPFGVDERCVARWVAAYRRYGMTALRREAEVEGGLPRWMEFCFGWIGAWRRNRGAAAERIARRIRVTPDEPAPHWRWN